MLEGMFLLKCVQPTPQRSLQTSADPALAPSTCLTCICLLPPQFKAICENTYIRYASSKEHRNDLFLKLF